MTDDISDIAAHITALIKDGTEPAKVLDTLNDLIGDGDFPHLLRALDKDTAMLLTRTSLDQLVASGDLVKRADGAYASAKRVKRLH